MASYVVMRPPGLQGDANAVRFIRDGFSAFALVFPPVWMLANRLWLYAVLFVLVTTGFAAGAEALGAGMTATPILTALNLLVALESGEIRQRHLLATGWRIDAVVSADNLDQAEEIYFSSRGQAGGTPSASAPAQAFGIPVLGLFNDARGR